MSVDGRRGPKLTRPIWPLLLGLAATGFLLYLWVWAATQGGPPFWS